MTLSQVLRDYREIRQLTPATLAARCQVVAPQLRGFRRGSALVSLKQWESGYQGRRPSPAQLLVLARALQLTEAETVALLEADLADELVRGSRAAAAGLAA